jgi:hypothetical protein
MPIGRNSAYLHGGCRVLGEHPAPRQRDPLLLPLPPPADGPGTPQHAAPRGHPHPHPPSPLSARRGQEARGRSARPGTGRRPPSPPCWRPCCSWRTEPSASTDSRSSSGLSSLRRSPTECSAVQCSAVQCSAVQCSAVQVEHTEL